MKQLYDVAEKPPLGEVPEQMHAWLIRPERFGEPTQGFETEVIDVPDIADDEVLVYVMAAGVNYNNVWASLGIPINVIAARNKAGEPEEFHIGGSDASGVVYKVGKDVTDLKVGDEVVVHCGTWSRDCPMVSKGVDPMYSPTFRIWGYETNYGSFAQFTKVQAHQCLPKPPHLSWEDAAAYMLVGATAYRMLMGWPEHAPEEGDPVLVWGGAGGLGSMAIQIAAAVGAVPIAVVSSTGKFEYCEDLGAKGCINRKDFDHWGMLPHWKDAVGYKAWLGGARKFGKAIWEVLGERKSPKIVFEHPGEATIPTSIFVCQTGGSVVICAGTTGYNATVDLRYLWMRQKRLQGSHFANDDQAKGINDLVMAGKVDPCLSRAFTWNELPDAHQLMYENKHPHGNMSILVGAPEFGLGKTAAVPAKTSHVEATKEPRPYPPRPLSQGKAQIGFMPGDGLATEDPVSIDQTPVGDLMQPAVFSCLPDGTVDDAAHKMVDHDVHALIVVDGVGAPVGVISQTDIVLARQGRTPDEVKALTVAAVMTPGCMACSVDTPVGQAITLMTRHRIHRLAVVQGDRAVGVLSMTDLVRKLID